MSELKAMTVLDVQQMGCYDNVFVYFKSEADKVIAELKTNLSEIQSQKMQLEDDVALLRRNNAELKESVKGLILDNHLKDKEIRHQKYKRCLAMAKVCKLKRIDAADYRIPRRKWDFYDKWLKRWLSLADKFKEAK